RWHSTIAEYETATRRHAPRTSPRSPDTNPQHSACGSNLPFQTPADTSPAPTPLPSAIARNGHPGPCAPISAPANAPETPATPAAQALRLPACPGSHPRYASKFASSRNPLLQPNGRDFVLLFCRLVQVGHSVVPQTTLKNLQNLRRRLPCGADNEHSIKLLFV